MAILRRDCPHCPATSVAFEIKFAERNHRQGGMAWNCLGMCGACSAPICFIATAAQSNNHAAPHTHSADIEGNWRVPVIWPARQPSGAPPHTPRAVASRFIQGENAYRRGDWNAAVAMYRSALDIAAKGMPGVEGKDFFQRLKWLHDNNKITPEIRSWADHVRVEGNEALHDPDEFTENDAKPLRLFTEMFLRYVFELPGEVRTFRGEPDPDAPAPAPAPPA